MGLKIHLNDFEDIVYESGTHQYNVDEAGIYETQINYNHKNVTGSYNEIILENFKIGYGNNRIAQKTTLFFEFEEETVEMHFTLQGNSKTSIHNLSKDLYIHHNSHNIFYCSDIKGKVEWDTENVFFFEINLQPSFFEQYLPEEDLFDSFKKVIQNKEIGFLSPHNHPITSDMQLIINQIISCSWKGKYRQLFLEAKVLELLLLQLEQIKFCNLCPIKSKTSKNIIDKMYYAQEVVLDNLNNPMCLSDLAKVVGTNECTLKKEFKQVFGATVFNFIANEKMEKAKKLLLNNKLSISEVSDITGYKNPQHFSTAFKKKYGVTPSLLKKNYS